jgi:hypothetical protein
MNMRRLSLLPAVLLSIALPACGPKNGSPTSNAPGGAAGTPAEAACTSDGQDQPFVISWDATDRSMFESTAASHLVFVKYEGCNMTVLDECSLDSGSYGEVQWSPGNLETIDIRDQNQLMNLLPLAASMLGARVSSGESFHMEYYIAGSKTADTQAVAASDIAGRPGCDGATHLVQGFDLGAFALGSAKNLDMGAGGSKFGFQVEASASKSQSAERKGGDLSACNADDPEGSKQCQSTIRLTLAKLN